MKLLVVLLWCFALMVVGCATPTPYQAADNQGLGYKEQQIEGRRYRVTFRGNSLTPRETVELYLLHRAAEITVANGFDHFRVVDQDTESKILYPAGSAFYGSYGFGAGRRSGLGLGYHWAPGSHLNASNRYEAVAYITLHKGPPPEEGRSYDAREVLKNLGPKIARPS